MVLQKHRPEVVRIDIVVKSIFTFLEQLMELLLVPSACWNDSEATEALKAEVLL